MNTALSKLINIKINKAVKSLKEHNFIVSVVDTKEEAYKLVESLIPADSVVGFGGSMTLQETKIINLVNSGKYQVLDRTKVGITAEKKAEVERQIFNADYFLSSSNAITEDGYLYNMDGYNNRVSALLFGPKKVLIVVGYNKIVPDLASASQRIKQIAAPANCIRLELPNPCTTVGHCMDCRSEYRICNGEVIIRNQRDKERIHIIIVKEELGF